MIYVPKNKNPGSRPRTSSFSSLRRELADRLRKTSREVILKAGFNRITSPGIPKIEVKEVAVLRGRKGYFKGICQILDFEIHKKISVSLTMHVDQRLIANDFKRIIASLPAIVCHELGHMVYPSMRFWGNPLPDIFLPFARKISFPVFSIDVPIKDYPAWKETCMDVIGVNLMPDTTSQRQIKASFSEFSKLFLSELFMYYSKATLARPFQAARFVAMLRHVNRNRIPKELLPLLNPLLQDIAVNNLIEETLRFIRGTTVTQRA